MDRVNYIVSDKLDYSKLICNDAGPGYAKSMSWDVVRLSSLKKFSYNEIYVIDNRIDKSECDYLASCITENPEITFIVKIVDPYLEHQNSFYYKWIISILKHENIRLLTVYEPKELTAEFAVLTNKPIIYIPYVYDEAKEQRLDNLLQRKSKVIISGSINKIIYPYRSKLWLKSRRSLSRIFFTVLKHPGYQEMQDLPPAHKFVADKFISYLSGYKFMLLCGSRCNIEFLKFHECAYAGCMPIGEAPTCYPNEIKSLFKKISPITIFFSALKVIANWEERNHIEVVEKYRDFLRNSRNQAVLHQSFLDQLRQAK
ncbi:hypothetical protein [Pedobacter sp. KLB.chiD]|uniref:hypothetical protein n=1 Tax=Pedobacter sp. KLB.chiD TaxID=3387402 RepID=UPI00399B634F